MGSKSGENSDSGEDREYDGGEGKMSPLKRTHAETCAADAMDVGGGEETEVTACPKSGDINNGGDEGDENGRSYDGYDGGENWNVASEGYLS